jgi:heme A synthase
MRKVYAVLAWIVAGGVVVQAASIAFGLGGMSSYIQDGGVVDKALIESRQADFVGVLGFPIHGMVGGMLIPIAAFLLLIVSFFVKVRGARMWAAIVFGLIMVQITLGYYISDMPYLGLIHGANALAVLLTAVFAALRISRSKRTSAEEPAASDVVQA